ncbi:hypothetical protein ACFLT8_03615 [Chloroflexota bacterium]
MALSFGDESPITAPANQNPHTPVEEMEINSMLRYKLLWASTQLGPADSSGAGGATVTLTFVARAEQDISGNSYNELIVTPKNFPDPDAFGAIPDFPEECYSSIYSRNSGAVIVPAFD